MLLMYEQCHKRIGDRQEKIVHELHVKVIYLPQAIGRTEMLSSANSCPDEHRL